MRTEVPKREAKQKLTKTRLLYLQVKQQAHSMAKSLGLRRLQAYFQGSTYFSSSPVWILGKCYRVDGAEGDGPEERDRLPDEIKDELQQDLESRIRVTYRWDFPALDAGDLKLTSDVGWGCTIRSGQMLMAQALLNHMCGRNWRLPPSGDTSAIECVVKLFWDDSEEPLSIHNICKVGEKHGLIPGRWLGPWMLCHALKDLIDTHKVGGLKVWLISHRGGGAPFIDKTKLSDVFNAFQESSVPPNSGNAEKCEGGPNAGKCESSRNRVGQNSGRNLEGKPEQSGRLSRLNKPGLVILVPLVLGADVVNEKYFPQLKAILKWPQSVGIIGGRPSSSLYFFGFQDDNIIYLDPHESQEFTSPLDMSSYVDGVFRHMPLKSIDRSMALGFYCGTKDEVQDLVSRLEKLEKEHPGTPLINVTTKPLADELLRVTSGPLADEMVDRVECVSETRSVGDEEDSWQLVD